MRSRVWCSRHSKTNTATLSPASLATVSNKYDQASLKATISIASCCEAYGDISQSCVALPQRWVHDGLEDPSKSIDRKLKDSDSLKYIKSGLYFQRNRTHQLQVSQFNHSTLLGTPDVISIHQATTTTCYQIPYIMKFNATLIVATLLTITAAVDLRLFKNANDCKGDGIICQDIPNGRCCSKNGELFGSTQGSKGGKNDAAAPFTKQGDNYCAIQIKPTKKFNYCFKTGLASSVGGTSWEHQGKMSNKRDNTDLAACTGIVEGADMYSDGSNTYIISKEKMTSLPTAQQVKPTDDQELLEYFKTHADSVIADEKDDSTEQK
jgi:hypothetical protein